MEKRLRSLDTLRGLAVILMIYGHVYYLWITRYVFIVEEISLFIIFIVPPFFLLISGMSYYFYIRNKILNNFKRLKIFFNVLKRAIFIFVITLLFQICFGFTLNMQIDFVIYWSVFQVIAFSMLAYFIILFLNRYLRIMCYLTLFFVSFLINHLIILYEIEFLYILIEAETFPFIPWSNFFLFGIFTGDVLINHQFDKEYKLIIIYFLIGAICLILWAIWIRFITYLHMSQFFISIGLFLMMFSIYYFYLDVKQFNFFLVGRIIQWGKLAFSIYYIQFAMIVGALVIYQLLINDLFSQIPQVYLLFGTLIVFYGSIELFLHLWKKFSYIFSIE